MKRFTLKRVIAILTAMILFAIYLLTCFPLINTNVFSWEATRGGGSKNGTQTSDNAANSADTSSDAANNIFTFDFKNPVTPEISDYILVSITAKNTGQAKYPYGSIAINLSEEKMDLLSNAATPGNDADDIKGISNDNITDDSSEDIIVDESYNIKGDKVFSDNITDGSNAEANIAGGPGIYKIQERTRIFVDGIRHTYYIPVGENKYWQNDWNLAGPTLKGQISRLEIEIPEIEGIDIQINNISINKRPVFAIDSYINYFFKSCFQLSYIDPFLTPAYAFLILFVVVFSLLCFLSKRTGGLNMVTATNDFKSGDLNSLNLKSGNSSFRTAKANNIYADNLNLNIKKNIGSILESNSHAGARVHFKTFAMLVSILLLVFFSFYFVSNYIFTVKGYWDSYKQYILNGRLDETYYGFSDFEKFVNWVGEKVPQNQNVIVLVKGEPIYIMAQTAYGLYPRDVKFLDISSMSAEEVADKITSLDFTYEYIAVLSEADKVFLESVKVRLEYSYRENAGFLYKLILK